MDKIGILRVGTTPTLPDWETHKRMVYEQLCEKCNLSSEDIEVLQMDRAITPVMLPPEPPPVKICEFQPTPIERGRGRSVMNEEHYQNQIAKRRKKNKNKKTHRK